ncbi:MAG: hypothetical protein ABSD13_01035 [Candidatus Korobacteraceae bacterium]|jgi:hypothetical protein
MDADYSIELGPTAPALEIPWQDPEGRSHYVNLRLEHGTVSREIACMDVAQIPEARQFPALGRFLVKLNLPADPWQTAKCDVWLNETNAVENLYNLGFEQSCYIDIVLAGNAAALRPSLEVHQRLAREFVRLLETNESLEATAEIVVRRCYFHHSCEADDSDAGYCLTLFLFAYGASPPEAAECWEHTLGFAAECFLRLQPHDERAKAQELS